MFLQDVSNIPFTTTLIKIKYDCCDKEYTLKWKDAKKNFDANGGKHICRSCKLKTDNPAKRPDVKAKTKKTVEEKYGGVLPINTPEQIAKRKEQFKDQGFVEQLLEKRKETCFEKYGAEHHMKSEAGKEAVKTAMREKYGVDYPLQAEEVKEKMRQTCQERYGVDNIMDVPEVKSKVAQTMMDRYGVERYNKLPEMKDYLRENCREWLKESWENPWAKGITRPEEWNQKQRESVRSLMLSGRWTGGFKSNIRGRFPAWKCKKELPCFLSSLELMLHYWLNKNESVEYYDYEGLSIEYVKPSDQKIHLYFPDFQIKYVNDDVIHVLETKTYKEKDNRDVISKQDAAFEYCNKNNMRYSIIFDADVHFLVNEDLETIKLFPGIVWQNNS